MSHIWTRLIKIKRDLWKQKESYTCFNVFFTRRGAEIRRDLTHDTGWRGDIGYLNLYVISRKRATNYRALLREMTYKDQEHYEFTPTCTYSLCRHAYGVATMSSLLEIIGLFCKRALRKRLWSAKETYDLKEPTNRSHTILELRYATHCTTLQHTATYCITLHHTATHWHCTASHCKTFTQHIQTYAHTHRHTHIHTHTHTLHPHTHTHTDTDTDTTHTHKHTSTQTHIFTHAHSHTTSNELDHERYAIECQRPIYIYKYI